MIDFAFVDVNIMRSLGVGFESTDVNIMRSYGVGF
jgi:hypothetical protein